MRGISGTAKAKALILAAIPAGAVGFLLTGRWAIVAIVANLVLLAAGGGLWWFEVRWARRWPRLNRVGVPDDVPEPEGDDAYRGALDHGDPESVVLASRRVRRHQLTLSTTSRLRRYGMRRSVTDESAGGAKDLTMVANSLTQIQGVLQSAQRNARREQLWWLVAGLAASIPIGVAINLATG
ncbi:hypothetical protein DKT68_09370 [Micromonospora acroterricola]|uniref:Uncharacterized protein n=1 Tax=Micromonospora acroterricola TaxID=2202421 RepID=A0A317DC50_9ACTN|nr:hypothetical protein [Micromonospora acroterricola]PWR10235.1 hypothetical protein DKT68_09370 [Micromonospora acroterricola]